MIANEKEIEFYIYFSIAPIGLLSNCQYDNEFRLGLEYGEDVCEHVEKDPDSYSCKTCEKSKQETLYYPPITDDILLNLILICGLDGLNLQLYYSEEHKEKILNYCMLKSYDERTKQQIRDLLVGHLREWSRI